MEQHIEDFTRYMREIKNASENTIVSYNRDLRKFFYYLSEQKINSVNKINETCLNSYILYMEKEGFQDSTVSRNIASIKSFLLYIYKRGMLLEDPTERIKLPKVERKKLEILSVRQINSLLDLPDMTKDKGIRDKAMLELLYATGIRVSELIQLRYEDVNLKNNYIICRTGNRERILPFGVKAKEALNQYATQKNKVTAAKRSETLFTNTMGQPMTRQGFWKILKSYALQLGMKEITPNMLRQSFANHLLENGADIYTLQGLLGLSDISSTQAYFTPAKQKLRDVYMKTHPRA